MASSLILPGTPSADGITFDPERAKAFILEPAFGKPEITAFHTVDTDIKSSKQLAYIERFGKVGITDTGCGDPSNQASLGKYEKNWTPVDVLVELTQCEADLRQSLVRYATANGWQRSDLNNNQIYIDYMQDYVIDAVMESALRRAWLGDTAVVLGELTNGATDVPFYDLYDGFYEQILDSVAAGGTRAARRSYTITENADVTKAAQLNLGSTVAYDAFKAIVNGADARLNSQGDRLIVCSRTMAQNYADYLQEQGVDPSFVRIEEGYDRLTYQGVPIYVFDLWDRYVQSDFDNGTIYTRPPHIAVMTTAENLRLGVDAVGSYSDVDFFFDKYTRQNVARVQNTEDVKIVHDFLISAAY